MTGINLPKLTLLAMMLTCISCQKGDLPDRRVYSPTNVAWLVSVKNEKAGKVKRVRSIFVSNGVRWRAEIEGPLGVQVVVFDGNSLSAVPKGFSQDPSEYDLGDQFARDMKTLVSAEFIGRENVGPYVCERFSFGKNAEFGEIWMDLNDHVARKRTAPLKDRVATWLIGDMPKSITSNSNLFEVSDSPVSKSITGHPDLFNVSDTKVKIFPLVKESDWAIAS